MWPQALGRSGGERLLAALRVRHEAAGLPDENDAGRHVPGAHVALPISVETAAGHVGDVQGRGAEAAQARRRAHDGRRLLQEKRVVAVTEEGNAAANERVREIAP